MATSRDIGANAVMTIGGTAVPALVRNTTPRLAHALRTVLASNGTSNPIQGHAPGNSGRSQFQASFLVPITGGAALLNASLATTPFTIVLAEGTAGGASLASCQAVDFQVSGAEGGDIEAQVTFESTAEPTWTPTLTASATGDFWKFSDVVGFTGVAATSRPDVMRFAFRIQPTLAQFRGNSTTGLPKYQKRAYKEVTLMAEYLKIDDLEGAQALGVPLPTADCTLTLQSGSGGTPPTLTLVCQAGFYDDGPQFNGDIATYVTEMVTATANLGAFSIT